MKNYEAEANVAVRSQYVVWWVDTPTRIEVETFDVTSERETNVSRPLVLTSRKYEHICVRTHENLLV